MHIIRTYELHKTSCTGKCHCSISESLVERTHSVNFWHGLYGGAYINPVILNRTGLALINHVNNIVGFFSCAKAVARMRTSATITYIYVHTCSYIHTYVAKYIPLIGVVGNAEDMCCWLSPLSLSMIVTFASPTRWLLYSSVSSTLCDCLSRLSPLYIRS